MFPLSARSPLLLFSKTFPPSEKNVPRQVDNLCGQAVREALGRNRRTLDAIEYSQREWRPLVNGGLEFKLIGLRIKGGFELTSV